MLQDHLRELSRVGNTRGSVLVIGLVLVVILTLMGVAALFTTQTEIQITSNYKDSVQALYAAESGAQKVFDAFKQSDTDNNGVADANDTANADNDLDNNGTIDFIQVFTDSDSIGSENSLIEVNNGDTKASIWVDASLAPEIVVIHSTGTPEGTKSRRTVALSLTGLGDMIHGALNNAP